MERSTADSKKRSPVQSLGCLYTAATIMDLNLLACMLTHTSSIPFDDSPSVISMFSDALADYWVAQVASIRAIRYLGPVLLLTSYTNPATRKRYSSNN